MSKGLLAHPNSTNWQGMDMLDGVYLALDSEAAISYAETSDFFDEYDGDDDIDIILLKIPYTALDETAFIYDWNNKCGYYTDINSCVYRKNIPASNIQIVSNPDSEPYQDIDSFEGTYLYEVLLDTFDYEVEPDMEDPE
jgi:hypothetical protein